MAAVLTQNPPIENLLKTTKPRLINVALYLKKYAKTEDGFKYEYNDGILEKTQSKMNPEQFYIIQNLNDRLIALNLHPQGSFASELIQNTTPTKYRKPDLAFLTRTQTRQAALKQPVLAEFMLEIISDTDNINRINKKLFEYFAAGVKMVWHIFPQQEMVYIYTSPRHVTICMDTDLCSASLVLPTFEISVVDLFKI